MNAAHIQPSELLAALEAYGADQKLETQGKAIRILVTDMLIQLGYLPRDPVEEPSPGDEGLENR